MENSFAKMPFSKPTKAESATPQDASVDGCLSCDITANMKVAGAFGNEDSVVVESPATAVAKSAPAAVPFGLGLLRWPTRALERVCASLHHRTLHRQKSSLPLLKLLIGLD
jgi:hypothetical protein